jgi:hypothetical protein
VRERIRRTFVDDADRPGRDVEQPDAIVALRREVDPVAGIDVSSRIDLLQKIFFAVTWIFSSNVPPPDISTPIPATAVP